MLVVTPGRPTKLLLSALELLLEKKPLLDEDALARFIPFTFVVNAYSVFPELAGVRVNEPLIELAPLLEPVPVTPPAEVALTFPLLNSEPEMVCWPLTGGLSETEAPPELNPDPVAAPKVFPLLDADEPAETMPGPPLRLAVWLLLAKGPPDEVAWLLEDTVALIVTSAGAGAIQSKAASPARRNAAARPRWRAKPNKRIGETSTRIRFKLVPLPSLLRGAEEAEHLPAASPERG